MRSKKLRSRKTRHSLAALLTSIFAATHSGPAVTQVLVPAGPGTQNEPSITWLPNNVAVVGYNVEGDDIGFAVSAIGGGAWPNANLGLVPFPPPFRGFSDPAVDFNSRGQVFYAAIGINPNKQNTDTVFVAPSLVPFPAAPPFWQPAVSVLPASDGYSFDKPYIAIDRVSPAPPNGSRDNIYVSFKRSGRGKLGKSQEIQFSRSTNFGLLYSRPVTISTPVATRENDYRNQSIPAAGPINRVYVAWAETPNSEVPSNGPGVIPGVIQIQRSTDGGRFFPNPAVPAAPVRQVEGKRELRNGSRLSHTTVPTMAVNTVGALAGQVYVAFADRRGQHLDIFFTRDTDAGFPAMPVRINSNPDTMGNDHFMPWMAINSQGVIAVVFYSKLNNETALARVDAVCSADGGVSWTRDSTISGAQTIFLDTSGFALQGRFGEYIGLAAHDTSFNAAWTADSRVGNPPELNQDIFTTIFTCPDEADYIAQPVAFDVNFTADQVIATTSSSTVAAAAFQSPTDMPGPEVVIVDLPRRALLESFALPGQPVTDVVIAPNNLKAAVIDAFGFDIIDLTASTIVPIPVETLSAASEIAITPDSRKALIALSSLRGDKEPGSQEISIFDLVTASRASVSLSEGPFSGIAVTPDSSKALIAAGSAVQVIDVAAAARTEVPLDDPPDTGIALTPSGGRALIAAGHNVYIIDVATLAAATVPVANLARTDIVITPDGGRAILASATEVDIIDVLAATNIAVPLTSPPFTGADVTPDGTKAVIRDAAGAHIVTLATGADVVVPLSDGANAPFTNAVITPDGTRAIFGDSKNLDIIGLVSGTDQKIAINGPPVISIAVTPNGRLAVFGTANRLNVADVVAGALNIYRLGSDETPLTGASISPDGRRASILTNKGMQILDLTDLTRPNVLLDRTPRLAQLNLLPEGAQPSLPPLGDRGMMGALDGR